MLDYQTGSQSFVQLLSACTNLSECDFHRNQARSVLLSTATAFGFSDKAASMKATQKSMRNTNSSISAICILVALCASNIGRAANLTTTNNVGGNTGWNTVIWKTNAPGTATSTAAAVGPPVAGNTYEAVPNGIAFGNSTLSTRLRNLYQTTDAQVQIFPGDSLTLYTNTELRFKRIGTSTGTIPTCTFPGVGGNAGLILNGGILNAGDDGVFPVAGKIQVVSQSYICTGDNGGGGTARPNRGITISGQLTGNGAMVIFQGTTNTPQTISGTSNTFSGQWIVKAGRLVGTAPGSLGTNSITLDPAYTLPDFFSTAAPIVDFPGPAVFEPSYDINSAGKLTLANGGIMWLHQNCAFTAVSIEGTPLSSGTHFFAELNANFPNTFPPGGSGSITVQPFGAPPAVAPTIATQPVSQSLYAGKTARFTSTGAGQAPLSYRWLKGGVPMSDGANVSGSTNTTLIITNVSAADAAGYSLVVSNAGGPVTSSVATLTIASLSGEAYEAAVLAANPVAFYQLNETADPAAGAVAFDFQGGYAGPYGTGVQNGAPAYNVPGPKPTDGFTGFGTANRGASFLTGTAAARITVTPWNLNTNSVTLVAWLNPNGPQTAFEGIVFSRGGGTVAGLNYSGSNDLNGNFTLGYTWNNEADTYNWSSGIAAPPGQWSLVALVVTPTNATVHVMNTNGFLASTHSYPHVVQAFGGTTLIGDDSAGANGSRTFNGLIDDVAVFNGALTPSQLIALYTAAAGAAAFKPAIGLQPESQSLYAGQSAQFSVGAGGSQPLSYNWKAGAISSGVFTNLTDGGRISGASSSTLTVGNLTIADNLDFVVVVSNSSGSVTSSVASLTISPTSAAETITMSVQQAANNDWNTGLDWSDGNPASISAVAKPGSTYRLLAGGRLRTPLNPVVATFPGNQLMLEGDGVWNVNPAAGATISEIRFKQPTYGQANGVVNFKKLIMNGGQLDAGNDGTLIIGGEINILTNAPINNDSGNDRGYRLDARLTGNGTIEYHAYNQATFATAYSNNLNIAGTSNTFSGKWNVVTGTLLGTGTNGLGTNDITVGAQGALETTYDVRNTNGNLFLTGRMFLHQNDTFRSVFVNGVPLTPGTHTFAELSATYSNNFPATWTPQNGAAAYSNGSGSLVVLAQPAPTVVQDPVSISRYPTETALFSVIAQGNPPLFYQWRKGGVNLSNSGNISGVTSTNLTLTNLTTGNAGNYDVVITNSVGSVTSRVAVLTILPTGPAETITLSIAQAQGNDWNTISNWSDGLAASVSAVAKPGSSYEVLAGGRLRTPANAADATFPGNVLTLQGDGVFVNGGTSLSEIRFKHSPGGTVRFKKLVMNGGQLDSASDGNGLVVITGGEMSILANAPLYNDGGNDRGFRIDSWLTGGGSIELHAYTGTYNAGYVQNLNITGTSNTFTGTWNVVTGVLLGSAPNSLGTNKITVGVDGALETLYNISNPQGELILDGRMFLHQNVAFRSVTISGTTLAPGTYSFAQLTNAYPANFPATWNQQAGSTFSTGSGSLTVGSAPAPVNLQFEVSASNLKLTWAQGILLEANNVNGPWTTNSATSPFNVTPNAGQKFYRIQMP